jgi:phage gp29-like protein
MPDDGALVVQPKIPVGEFAAPRSYLDAFGGYRRRQRNNFFDALTPDDSVLSEQGGIQNIAVYKELLRDDQVGSTFQQRRLRVVQTETMVDPGADDALSKQAADVFRDEELPNLVWDDITDKMLYSRFYGWAIGEILWQPNIEGRRVSFGQIKVRQRERFRYSRADGGIYLVSGADLIPMPDRKFWSISVGAEHSDEPYGVGLARSLYWPVWFKRNDIQFWLIFLEKFGMPTVAGKVNAGLLKAVAAGDSDTGGEAYIAKVMEALEAITTDSAVILPEDVPIELIEATRSGAADYESLKDAMDAAIAKVVMSQTMTTDDGSSRAQAEVHEGVADSVVKADADLINESFMRGPLKWWCEWNFPGAAVPRVWRNIEPPEDLNIRAERDVKIKQLGYKPTPEYIEETYGEGFEEAEEVELDPLTGKPKVETKPGEKKDDDKKAEFSEAQVAALDELKKARRNDQNVIANAADQFATDYAETMDTIVKEIVARADRTGDYRAMAKEIDAIFLDPPDDEMIEKVTRSTVFTRLLGKLRGQRK